MQNNLLDLLKNLLSDKEFECINALEDKNDLGICLVDRNEAWASAIILYYSNSLQQGIPGYMVVIAQTLAALKIGDGKDYNIIVNKKTNSKSVELNTGEQKYDDTVYVFPVSRNYAYWGDTVKGKGFLTTNPYLDKGKIIDKNTRWEQDNRSGMYSYKGDEFSKNCYKCNIYAGDVLYSTILGYVMKNKSDRERQQAEYDTHTYMRGHGLISSTHQRYQQVRYLPGKLAKTGTLVNINNVKPGAIVLIYPSPSSPTPVHMEILTYISPDKKKFRSIGAHRGNNAGDPYDGAYEMIYVYNKSIHKFYQIDEKFMKKVTGL